MYQAFLFLFSCLNPIARVAMAILLAELPQEKKWTPPPVVFLQEACDHEWRRPSLCTRMMHIGRALSPHLDFDSGRESVCRPQEIIEAFEVFDEAGFQPNARVH